MYNYRPKYTEPGGIHGFLGDRNKWVLWHRKLRNKQSSVFHLLVGSYVQLICLNMHWSPYLQWPMSLKFLQCRCCWLDWPVYFCLKVEMTFPSSCRNLSSSAVFFIATDPPSQPTSLQCCRRIFRELESLNIHFMNCSKSLSDSPILSIFNSSRACLFPCLK